jgi:peptide/nickel transport system permease protein
VEKIPYIVSGTIVVEYLFDWPGLGYQLLQEVQQVGDKSYFFLLIATIFLVAVVLLLNLLRDLVTVINDPRLRRQ